MYQNFLRIALRNMRRHKGYAALNILGLAVGLACVFFIAIWVQDEISTNRFHEDGDRVYSVMRHSEFGGRVGTTVSMPKPLAQAMLDEYPEVENTIITSWETWMMLRHGDEVMRTPGRWAGADFFEVFTFPLLAGDPTTALDTPESVVLTEDIAERFFGSDWRSKEVLGQVITVDNRVDLTITGVAENPPANNSLTFTFIVPAEEYIRRNSWVERWDNNGLNLWARLRAGTDLAAFNAKIKDHIDRHVDVYESDVFLYPIDRTYLYNDFENGVQVGGRIEYVRAFSLVALLIIVIASINFMNLATARSSSRALEIGVRKTIGASRQSLAGQFLGESMLKAGFAFLLAALLVVVLLPSFNTLTQKAVSLASLGAFGWLGFVGIALFTGLLAGTYPALYLSGFGVAAVLGKRITTSGRGSGLRKGLVVAQFAMSIVLIVGTMTVYRQLDYLQTRDLGLERENVLMVRLEGGIRDQYDTFKRQLLQVEGVSAVTTSSINPLQIGNDTIGVEWEGKDPDDNTLFWNGAVGYDFVEALGIRLADGRAFSEAFGRDSTNYLVNQRAAEAMGMENPVGQDISFWDVPGTILGLLPHSTGDLPPASRAHQHDVRPDGGGPDT